MAGRPLLGKIGDMPDKRPPNLDQRLINSAGRLPTSIIIGPVVGAITELFIRMSSYGIGSEDLDALVIYLRPFTGRIMFYGALGGLAVGIIAGVVTGRLEKKINRVIIGLALGVIARVVAEIVVRTIKEGQLEYALDFLWILRYQIIISGAVVGMVIGLLPLAEREEISTKTQRTQREHII
jgi:hypothetical protein